MIRKDGTYTIYCLQYEWVGTCTLRGGRWVKPYERRSWMHTNGDRFKRPEDLRNRLNACGECWQTTGIEGTFDRVEALAILAAVRRLNPDTKFRLQVIEISQKTTVLDCNDPAVLEDAMKAGSR